MEPDRFLLTECLWLLAQPTGVPIYDFDFRRFFDCRTPYDPPAGLPGIARIGAFGDYANFHRKCREIGIELVHSPEDHLRCTRLPLWYPLIEEDTPRSRWYPEIPSFSTIMADFELPVFIKGSRQTSKHQAGASIVHSRQDFERATAIFRSDPMLSWQEFVCRELIELLPVAGGIRGKIPPSFEFRTFWWKGELVGSGPYWYEAAAYAWTDSERSSALQVAGRAVAALGCDFLVVDLALTREGRWIVIECNDGMESGYAGISPFKLWQRIVDREQRD